MNGIGGNITAELQKKTSKKNSIGEHVPGWQTVETITGFLDLQSGDSKYTTFSAKIQDSTHVFVGDYVDLSAYDPENCRMLIGGKIYDVMLIDDPMELHEQIEIYLKYTGGQ